MRPSSCLVVLTDALYLPGTVLLLESWRDHNAALPVIALSRDKAILDDPRLRSLSHSRQHIDVSGYADIRPYKKSRSKRHGETFFKFEAFQDFGFERNIYLDSDILCMREAPALIEKSDKPLLAALDTGFKKTRGYKGHKNEINTGVLCINRSIQGAKTVESLKKMARENPGRSGYNSGDQGIINKWIHVNGLEVDILSSDYNLIKKDYGDTAGLEECRLLHFCGRKPWIDPSDTTEPLTSLWTNYRLTDIS